MTPNDKFLITDNFKEKLKTVDIIVCLDDSFKKIQAWSKEIGVLSVGDFGNIVSSFEVMPPFSEGKIDYGDKDMFFYFKIIEDEIKVYTILRGKIKSIATINYKNFEYKDFEYDTKSIKGDAVEEIKSLARVSASQVVMIFIYINEYKENITRIEKKEVKVEMTSSKKNVNKKKKSVSIGKYYIQNFEITPNENKRPFERHIDSWGVRGHWRTYKKSGKRIWIPEFKKGRGEKEAKEYVV